MTEVPGSHWLAAQDDKTAHEQAPMLKGVARWHRKTGVVTHVFTHFPLELVVYRTLVPEGAAAPDGMRWIAADHIDGAALPSLMRKVLAYARVE
jgi:A/G-specific adenine glycosylase